MGKLKKGYLQVYTGNGKGKTTAALGLAFRAAGNEYKVYMIQFLKTWSTGELNSISKVSPYFQVFRFEKPRGFFWTLEDEEKEQLKVEVKEAYDFAGKVLKERSCDILILDEIMGALKNGLVTEEGLLDLISQKPEDMEIILTGRNVPQSIIDKADLVTEMKAIKHYYEKGVEAREGIEF